MEETLFDLLLNALLQIGLFAVLAAVFSRLVAKAGAKLQYLFYLAVLLFCLTAPVFNTFWQSHTTAATARSQQQSPFEPPSAAGATDHPLWNWHGHSQPHREVVSCLLGIWGVLVLFRLARFSRAVHRVHGLRKYASILTPEEAGMAGHFIEARYRVALLQSAVIDDPVTVGVFHPVILMPAKVLPDLSEQELSAVIAHEYAHIRRRDFAVHLLCEFLSIPVAWHPGIRYVMAKISQSRELACDDFAATLLGKRRSYANTLLRLASLCLQIPRSNPAGLGIFDGDNLETRIMMLTEKQLRLSRAAVTGLALATAIAFGAGAVLAHAMRLQTTSESSNTADNFAGTWHWMFEGKSFATMILLPSASGFTGSVTASHIALNSEGGLLRADPSEDSSPSPITRATLEGSALHITVKDGKDPVEFTVTLKDNTHAEIHPEGGPPNMKPIPAEKVH